MLQAFPARAGRFQVCHVRRVPILSIRLCSMSLTWFVLLCAVKLVFAGESKVNVELGRTVNILTSTSIGLPAIMNDGDAFKPAAAQYTRLAGATVLRYPGNPGVTDIFHWSSGEMTHIEGEQYPYISPDSNFGNFAKHLDKFGTALIVVNYGTSIDGVSGGDEGEAAAWVAYANGDAADARAIPKSKNGENWQTVGYWATLRGQDPVAEDDGYNFLRIGHPMPLGIRQWQIGEGVFNNGFYGVRHTGMHDLHALLPAKGMGNREKNASLSPSFYGTKVAAFASAMKAVDPTIRIGASLALPDGQPSDSDWGAKQWAFDWDEKVLKAGCSAIDFVVLDWQPVILAPPDWKGFNEADMLSGSRRQIGATLNSMLSLYRQNCAHDHIPRIAYSTAAIPTWPRLDHPIFTALWVADVYPVLIETGVENVSWAEMHGANMFANDGGSFGAAFLGLEMLHIVSHVAGDSFVEATSNDPLLVVHATHRRDGVVGLMFVNENPNSPITVTVTLNGGAVASKGRRIDCGAEQQKSGAHIAQTEITGLGSKFTITVPAYTITDILVPPAS
jgi:hypothetical protein